MLVYEWPAVEKKVMHRCALERHPQRILPPFLRLYNSRPKESYQMSNPEELTVNYNMTKGSNTCNRMTEEEESVSLQRLLTQLSAEMYLDNIKILLTASKLYRLVSNRGHSCQGYESRGMYYRASSVLHRKHVHFVFDLTCWLQILWKLVQKDWQHKRFSADMKLQVQRILHRSKSLWNIQN
jgi:hypothetical protein